MREPHVACCEAGAAQGASRRLLFATKSSCDVLRRARPSSDARAEGEGSEGGSIRAASLTTLRNTPFCFLSLSLSSFALCASPNRLQQKAPAGEAAVMRGQ